MRQSVMIFGGISAVAAILLAAVFATVAWQRSALDDGGRKDSGVVASAIVPQEKPDQLVPRATSELRGDITPDRLGRLARYLAWVRIEKEKAAFQVVVMQRDGKWLVHGYRVERGQKLAAD